MAKRFNLGEINIPAVVRFALSFMRRWLRPLDILPMNFGPQTKPREIGTNLDQITVRATYPRGVYVEVDLSVTRAKPRRYKVTNIWGTVRIPNEFGHGPSSEGFVCNAVRERFPRLPIEARIWGGFRDRAKFNLQLDEAGQPAPLPPRPTTLKTVKGTFPINWAIKTLDVRLPFTEHQFPNRAFRFTNPNDEGMDDLRAELIRIGHRGTKICITWAHGYKNGYLDVSTGEFEPN